MMGRVSLFIFGFILMSCKQGQITNYSTPRPVNVSQVTLLDYAANLLEIKFEGSVGMENINSLDTLLFYLAPTCEGSSVGQVLAQDLPTNGVVLSLPDNNARDIYVSTVASNDCLLFYNYVPKETRPELIQYISISPLSPSRVNHSPGLKAKVFPSSGSVELYTDNQCTVKVGQGSANDFITYGIQANLPENMVSQIYAVVSDSLAQRSACSYLTEFEHRNQILDSPVFISSDPLSPTNVSGTAKIKGTAIAEASLIRIFDDSACLNEIAQGDPTEFTSSGLSITVSENSINNIYSKIEDSLGNESACALLTTYIYDTTPPVDPVYAGISPTSPNNSNLFPLVYGSTSSDTLTVKLYSDFLCLSTIGSGAKAAFNSTGVSAGVNENSTTMIYAKAFDSSGNASQCVYMTSYKHNTFAPNAPTFLSTSPNSPTNVTANPTIKGNVALYTHSLKFYDDEYCTNLVGQGTPSEYENGGISLTLQENFNNNIYVTVSDIEGNNSECVFHASYEHSNVPAPDISFNFSFPLSPTNASNQPYMMGTADPSIVDVVFYNDSSCSLSIGSGLRGQLISSGILVTVPVNSTTDIYAIARDEFNNYSTCHFFKTFIHNTINPNPPVYSSVSPVTPNASSITPLVKGTASTPGASQLPPYEVSFYDSSACANKIGESAASQFTGVGTQIAVPSNNVTNVYAKVFDEAGNSSSCTYLLDYTHDALKPGKPIFSSTLPQSPSYTTSFKIKGSFSASADFLNKTAVSFFSDVNCSL
ncbi:MAG: hypothetical protein KDD50_13225, partial [Bdellovibrionales bacterium]|nr:hypothetical protein [Bdellovibrionales bacterium]